MQSLRQLTDRYKARRANVRRALTMLELVFVVAILGIFTAMAVTKYGSLSLGNAGAQGYARKLALDLLQAKRLAICTSDNHFVQFQSSGGVITGHTLYQRTASGATAVDSFRALPSGAVITVSHTEWEFTFEGPPLAEYGGTVTGPDRSWVVYVKPLTGKAMVVEL